MTLTREQIETFLANAQRDLAEDKHFAVHPAAMIYLCTLALKGLAMEPRDGWVMVPVELTPEMVLAMHHQIDWCRDGQDTSSPRDDSQKMLVGSTITGTSCEDDLRDAWNAALSSLPTPEVKP